MTGALPRVPLVLAVGLSFTAGTVGAHIPDDITPPYGWGLSELSQPIPSIRASLGEVMTVPPAEPATATADADSGTQE